jgi:hypothetical protein
MDSALLKTLAYGFNNPLSGTDPSGVNELYQLMDLIFIYVYVTQTQLKKVYN